MPSRPLTTGVVPVAKVVHWFWPSIEYCKVYSRKSGVLAVPSIAVGMVTTGVTCGLVEAGSGRSEAVGRRQEGERLRGLPLVALGVKGVDRDREDARRGRGEGRHAGRVERHLIAVDQEDLAGQRLAVVRLAWGP